MSNNFTDTELLNQYLDRELDDSTTQLLEKRLEEESSLRLELEQLRLAREAVRLYGLKKKVKWISEEMNKDRESSLTAQKGTVRSISRWSLRVAAVIVFLVAGYGIYEYTRLSNAKLFAELYQPYEVRATRGEQRIDPVESAFRKKDYLNTIAAFHSIGKHTASDYFFVSQAYLQTNEPREAITNLQLALRDSSHSYKDESEYYLALAYLRANQLSGSDSLFRKIHADTNHLFHDKVSGWFLTKLSWLKK